MLTQSDIQRVTRGFSIYDHEWRAYAPTLGEPFLLGDCLAYYDGTVLYVCAYALGDTHRVISADEVQALISEPGQFGRTQAVVVWGRFAAPQALQVEDGEGLSRVMQLEDSDLVDSVVDLPRFLLHPPRAYKRGRECVLATVTTRLEKLAPEHLALMDSWAATHSVSRIHASFAGGVSEYVSDPAIYVTEARLDGRLLGFALISLSTPEHAVFLQNFNYREDGLPVGDAVYAAMYEFVAARGTRYLHLGYSATPGLLQFKRKWGAIEDQPPYREAGFTNDGSLAVAIREHRIDWRNRLYIPA